MVVRLFTARAILAFWPSCSRISLPALMAVVCSVSLRAVTAVSSGRAA